MSTTTETAGGVHGRRRGPQTADGDIYPQFRPKGPVHAALGAKLMVARNAAGKTIKQAADACGCSVNSYRMFESGASTMRVDMLLDFARFVEARPADLLNIGKIARG